ncbi:hypothetical protein BCR42DRAFT_419167 [Absidia repens]|uniref:Uncharacterized protein n=1 Tax=Absidia repens TaxID=90262 RepID=A0A1X2IAY7_9FUNG|nr:hypothetical protein BCR42DRAFT_419167 [Absidia repens]
MLLLIFYFILHRIILSRMVKSQGIKLIMLGSSCLSCYCFLIEKKNDAWNTFIPYVLSNCF